MSAPRSSAAAKAALDVVAPRAEIAQQDDGLALLHIAELELLAEQHRELGVIDGFMHGVLLRNEV